VLSRAEVGFLAPFLSGRFVGILHGHTGKTETEKKVGYQLLGQGLVTGVEPDAGFDPFHDRTSTFGLWKGHRSFGGLKYP
jgi:hypothetical protein